VSDTSDHKRRLFRRDNFFRRLSNGEKKPPVLIEDGYNESKAAGETASAPRDFLLGRRHHCYTGTLMAGSI
jgi:hypothetical protein